MPVLFDKSFVGVVFPDNLSYVAHTSDLPSDRVAEDNLAGDFLYCVLCRFDVDGHLLVVVADAAAEGRDALCLQVREKHLLSNAISLQTLAVNIEGYLFLLLTIGANVRHR